jgi:hypothetical protein
MSDMDKMQKLYKKLFAPLAILTAVPVVGFSIPSFADSGRMYSILNNKPLPFPATQLLLYPCGKVNDCEKLVEPLKTKDELYSLVNNGKQQFIVYTDINGQFSYKCPESECLVYARGSDEKNTYIWAKVVKANAETFELTHNNALLTMPIVKVQSYYCKGGPSDDETKLELVLNSWTGCLISDLTSRTGLVPDTQGEIVLPTGEQGLFYKMVLRKDGDVIFGNAFQYNSCTISLLTTKNGVIVSVKAKPKGNDFVSRIYGLNSRICKRALKGKNW